MRITPNAPASRSLLRRLEIYGPQTDVKLTVAKAQDVRLAGTFNEKAGVIREQVGEILGQAFGNLDLGAE